MRRQFQMPAMPELAGNLNDRFNALHQYFTHLFLPYLFNWADAAHMAQTDAIQFNVALGGAQDGVNTHFTCLPGAIRLDPTGKPQALLAWKGAVVQYVTGVPAPGQWTLVGRSSIVVGSAPGASDPFFFGVVVLE